MIARRGDEVKAVDLELGARESENLVYTTTDRPLCRPRQTVDFQRSSAASRRGRRLEGNPAELRRLAASG